MPIKWTQLNVEKLNQCTLVVSYFISCVVLQVRPTHVKEACRLLNKSIIRVEQPDIQLEEDEENGMPMGKC